MCDTLASSTTEKPTADEAFGVEHGLATLGPKLVQIRALLEEQFLRWAAEAGAESMLFPPLLRVGDLDELDHFRNFPHLPVLTSRIDASRLADYCKLPELACVPGADLAAAEYALPSAACYNVYLHLKGETLAAPRYITTVASCFRNEKQYTGLRRLWGFCMREIVCIGHREAVAAHLASFKERILAFTRRLGLAVTVEAGNDPFFQPEDVGRRAESVRALTQKLFPTKEELVYRDTLAIGSINFHRNFFGERCRIRTADGQFAFTGCVAFGIERWLHALMETFEDDPEAIASALRAA